jgi:hypothetical protein
MLSFKQFCNQLNEAKTDPSQLSDKEVMELYIKLKKKGKHKEAEALVDEIDKRGLKENTIAEGSV